jgi:uncharacterized membrane protein
VQGTVFGFTEQQISAFGLTWGIGAFILLMMFIIASVARESKAGRFGTFVLFFVLAFGVFGFLLKQVIQWWLGIG